jgi:hypothetical protein
MDGNNCNVLQTDDHSHVQKMTPLDIKRKELAEAKMMTEPQEKMQEAQTSERRQTTHARPLGGIK